MNKKHTLLLIAVMAFVIGCTASNAFIFNEVVKKLNIKVNDEFNIIKNRLDAIVLNTDKRYKKKDWILFSDSYLTTTFIVKGIITDISVEYGSQGKFHYFVYTVLTTEGNVQKVYDYQIEKIIEVN